MTKKCVFLANLPLGTTEDDIISHFKGSWVIEEVHVLRFQGGAAVYDFQAAAVKLADGFH